MTNTTASVPTSPIPQEDLLAQRTALLASLAPPPVVASPAVQRAQAALEEAQAVVRRLQQGKGQIPSLWTAAVERADSASMKELNRQSRDMDEELIAARIVAGRCAVTLAEAQLAHARTTVAPAAEQAAQVLGLVERHQAALEAALSIHLTAAGSAQSAEQQVKDLRDQVAEAQRGVRDLIAQATARLAPSTEGR